jgi:hypothetical protein
VRKFLLGSATAAIALSFASSAYAAVVIEQSPSSVQPEENVQLDIDKVPGDKEVRGTTNQTNSTVLFTSTSDNLLASPQGQAKITPIGSDDGLNNLTFGLEDLSTFTSAEFNILASAAGTVTLNALDADGNIIETVDGNLFDIGDNGQNFFGFLADSSTPISSIQIIQGTAVITSIGQFRVGGVMAAVPEPTTWMLMLMGMAGIGFSMRRKEKQTVRVRFA